MKVVRWGNSLAIRLPKAVVEALDLKKGDDVTIDASDGRHLSVVLNASNEELLARLAEYRGKLPPDFKFDRLEGASRLPPQQSLEERMAMIDAIVEKAKGPKATMAEIDAEFYDDDGQPL